jgi:ribosomal-protein-alanine N-acetyltransferase
MLIERRRIRQSTAADVPAMAKIEQEAAINPWSLSQFLSSSLREHEYSLVAEEGAGLVSGFCIYQRVLDEASLMNIAVRPGRQGVGLASLLLTQLQQTLIDAGVQRCLLEVRESNVSAIVLYRKFGFVDDAIRKDYYSTGDGREDAVLMSCQLVNEQ